MTNTLPELMAKGLTEEEAKILNRWLEEGKPGLSKYKAERLGEIYCLGYSCRDIQKWFPEYPLEVLLWARVHYKWDAVREQYRSVVQQDTLHAALAARMDGVRFLSDLMTATHVHWRKQLLDYIADPENAEAPKFLPKDMYGYQVLINMLKDVTTPAQGKKSDGGEENSPLVSVNISTDGKAVSVSPVTQTDIKAALIKDAARAKGE
jgi:hypothetical protein